MPEDAQAPQANITFSAKKAASLFAMLMIISFLSGLWTGHQMSAKQTRPAPILSKDDMWFVELNLWVMGYDVGEPDGNAEGKTFDSITQFLADYCIGLEDDPALLDLPKTTLYHAVIASAHPDWRIIKSSDEFGVWVTQQGKTVRESLDSGDPRKAISVLDQYKSDKTYSPGHGLGTECGPCIKIVDIKPKN